MSQSKHLKLIRFHEGIMRENTKMELTFNGETAPAARSQGGQRHSRKMGKENSKKFSPKKINPHPKHYTSNPFITKEKLRGKNKN